MMMLVVMTEFLSVEMTMTTELIFLTITRLRMMLMEIDIASIDDCDEYEL